VPGNVCDDDPMLGGRSIKLARVFGIRIGVDLSWFIVLFLIIWLLADAYGEIYPGDELRSFGLATVSALLFFLSVVLHELGHARVAIHNGIGIAGIDLWLFGGVAKMKRDTDSPGVEFRVAIAGPLVTLVIVALCAGALAVLGGGFTAIADPDGGASGAVLVLSYLGGVNLVLLLFNLIPAFPLDGGRILRAIAWWRTGDRGRATRLAARLGRVFSYFLIALGGFVLVVEEDFTTGIWFVVIGLFLGQAAKAAELQSRFSDRIEGLRVADVMDAQPVAISIQTPLDRAFDEFFLRYRWPWFPVVDATGHFVGLVSQAEVESVPEERRANETVDEVMTRDSTETLRVGTDEPLERLLDSHTDGLSRLGAIMAVDREGVLRGIVTMERLRRALRPATPAV